MRKEIDKLLNKKLNFSLCIYIISIIFILSYLSITNPIIPYTGDEAANILEFSRFGPIFPIFNYQYPNNHVLYSALQSIFVYEPLLYYFPEFPRVLNIIATLSIFIFSYSIFKKIFKLRKLYLLSLLFLILFISPLITPYFIVGRGYLLGLLFLLLGLNYLSKEKIYLSSFFFFLSVWTLPTFLYALPIVYIISIKVLPKKIKKLVVSTILLGLSIFIIYSPIIPQMIVHSRVFGFNSLSTYLISTIESLSNLSFMKYGVILNALFLVFFILSIRDLLKRNIPHHIRLFIIFLISSIISYLIIVITLTILLNFNQPYLRNGIFIPFFIFLIFLFTLAYSKNNFLKKIILIFIILNALVGIFLFISNFYVYKSPNYPLFEGEQKNDFQFITDEIKDLKTVTIPIENRQIPIVNYYLYIYSTKNSNSIEVANKISTFSSSFSQIGNSSQIDNFPIKESETLPKPLILPTSKLYLFKKMFQKISVNLMNYFDYSKKNSIKYKLHLSDLTYEEAKILMENKNYDLALNTIARAENYMTLIASDIYTLNSRQERDIELFQNIYESVILHKRIVQQLESYKIQKSDKFILDIRYIIDNNFQTMNLIK